MERNQKYIVIHQKMIKADLLQFFYCILHNINFIVIFVIAFFIFVIVILIIIASISKN